MKIGLSYSRCVRDIVDGTVDIDDVLVLITRTDFDPHNDDQWSSIWLRPLPEFSLGLLVYNSAKKKGKK